MIAIVGEVLLAIAGILKIVGSHGKWIIPLIIIGCLCLGAEIIWGWRRAGGYSRN